MKDLKDILNENIIVEASDWRADKPIIAKGFDMFSLHVRPNKEFGFIAYDEDGESVNLIAADNGVEMANSLGIAAEELEYMFKMKVGEVEKDIVNNTYTLRIW